MAAVTVNHHTASTGPNTTQTSSSFSFDATGDNYLVVYFEFRGVVSGVTATYNGVSMTLLGSAAPNTLVAGYTFGLANPATGSNTLAASWTGAAFVAYTVASVSGYVSIGTVQVYSSTTVLTATVTSTLGANDLLWAGSGGDDTANNFTITTGTTLDRSTGTTAQGAIDGYNTGTGSVSIVTAMTTTDAVVSIGVPIIGAASGGITLPFKSLLGVGI